MLFTICYWLVIAIAYGSILYDICHTDEHKH